MNSRPGIPRGCWGRVGAGNWSFPGNFLPESLEFRREWDKSALPPEPTLPNIQFPAPAPSRHLGNCPIPNPPLSLSFPRSQIQAASPPFPRVAGKPGISAPTSFPNPAGIPLPAGRILGIPLPEFHGFGPISSHPPSPSRDTFPNVPPTTSPKDFPPPRPDFWELFPVFNPFPSQSRRSRREKRRTCFYLGMPMENPCAELIIVGIRG